MRAQTRFLGRTAKEVVTGARANSTIIYGLVVQEASKVSEIDFEHWSYILTVAGVHMAIQNLNRLVVEGVVPRKTANPLIEIIVRNLLDEYPDASVELRDCYEHCENMLVDIKSSTEIQDFGMNDHEILCVVIGTWIAWNLLDPDNPENDTARAWLIHRCGEMTTEFFYHFWDKDYNKDF